MNFAHPCYDAEAHYKIGRIHLPVAPFCNIQCNYCIRKIKSSDNRPGVADSVISPKNALKRLKDAFTFEPRIQIAAVAGPGDPLANEATFETLDLIKQELPEMRFCLSTNGLLLVDKLPVLEQLGVRFITVTVNAVVPEIASKIYSFVRYKRKIYKGMEAASLLLEKQMEGIFRAAQKGFTVKVNTVLIPGINDKHLVEVAKEIRTAGAWIMNIMPLIPVGKFKDLPAPGSTELKKVRKECSSYIRQWYLCKQCRADAVGVPGEETCSRSQFYACPSALKQGSSGCFESGGACVTC
ncbi:radical SAM protein [Desulfovulcanus sp.]